MKVYYLIPPAPPPIYEWVWDFWLSHSQWCWLSSFKKCKMATWETWHFTYWMTMFHWQLSNNSSFLCEVYGNRLHHGGDVLIISYINISDLLQRRYDDAACRWRLCTLTSYSPLACTSLSECLWFLQVQRNENAAVLWTNKIRSVELIHIII